MLLESITLENFRQFRHESIDFAQGKDGKNVTIIIGDNGTGKTTFAQAFFWCMYGETEFSDKTILNKRVAAEMKPGEECKVQVTLSLRHGNVNYILMREQAYHKDYSNRVKGDNTIFDIAIKDAVGYECYDIAVANILADVIIPLQVEMPPHLKQGGIFITSGIIDMKEEEVKKAFEQNEAFDIIEINHQGDWVSIIARKK